VKRIVGSDGVTEMIVLTAAEYDDMAKQRRPPGTDSLYDQLNDERRQRLDISEKYRSCSEALARESNLVMRYRQLLIRNRLHVEPVDDARNVGVSELPEMFFAAADRTRDEEFDLTADGSLAESTAGYSAQSVQGTEEALIPSQVESSSSGVRQSVLESDEPVMMVQPVCTDDSSHDRWKNSADEAAKAAASAEARRRALEESRRQHQQLLDEASDALKTVPVATSSTMSRDLLQKVLEQNARLKLILKKILDAQGMSVREFLVSCNV